MTQKKTQFTIGGKVIQEKGRVFVIAEAGVNHNGDLKKALELVDVAAAAGADAVKFQTFKAEQVVNRYAKMAAYQLKNIGRKMSQQEMLKGLELPESFYSTIMEKCRRRKIIFLSTPHGGNESAKFLHKLKIRAYKIGSQDLTNYILLELLAKYKKPLILSSGMSTMDEIKNAISFIRAKGNNNIAVLHCTSNYPCPNEQINLRAMVTMMNELNVQVGFSDHSLGNQVAIMAATLGAAIYECHFTLDKKLPGPDHIASCDPDELANRLAAIRNVNIILGSDIKKPTKDELMSMRPLVRKSIVYVNDFPSGHVIKLADIEAKRPLKGGISPIFYDNFIGKKLIKNVKIDDQLTHYHFKKK